MSIFIVKFSLYVLKSFVSGLRENMVPGTATAALQVPSADAAIAMEEAFYQFIEANPVSGTIEADNTYVKIELVGKGAHGASPQSGINAGSFLALFLQLLYCSYVSYYSSIPPPFICDS